MERWEINLKERWTFLQNILQISDDRKRITIAEIKSILLFSFFVFILEIIFLTLEIPYSSHTLRVYDSVQTTMYFMFTIIHYLSLLYFMTRLFFVEEKLNVLPYLMTAWCVLPKCVFIYQWCLWCFSSQQYIYMFLWFSKTVLVKK